MTKEETTVLEKSGSPHTLNHLPALVSLVSSGLYSVPVSKEIGFMMDFSLYDY